MASAYRRIFALPGAAAFSGSGFVARMGHLVTVLGIVLLVSARTGGYGPAGTVAAAYAVSYALVSPWTSRLVDRYRQTRVLFATSAANLLARGGLLLAAAWAAPSWALVLLGAAGGATMPSVGALVRARWRYLVGGSPLLHTALSFESVVDEFVFVTGPIVVAAVSTYAFPSAGLGLALVLAVAGQIALAAQTRTDPAASTTAAGGRTVLAAPGFALLVLVFVGLGAVESVVDLATVAFASQHGARVLSGWILGTLAVGSVLSGLWYGARAWSASPRRLLVATLPPVVAGALLLAASDRIWVAFVAAFLFGLAMAPAVIAGFSLADEIVPPERFTEAMTWLTTGLGLGIAAGAGAAGRVADVWGTRPAFLIGAGCASVTSMVAVVVARTRSAATTTSTTSPS